MMILSPAAGAAFNSSVPEASALVALMIHPNFPGDGVVIEIAMLHPLLRQAGGPRRTRVTGDQVGHDGHLSRVGLRPDLQGQP